MERETQRDRAHNTPYRHHSCADLTLHENTPQQQKVNDREMEPTILPIDTTHVQA